MRLLLIEDAEEVTEAIVASFARAGHLVEVATTLDTARRAIRAAAAGFDVLVLDIDLPDGSGRTLLTELRAAGDATPVLMLTASLGIEERVSSLDGGADDYLTKPFDLRELQARARALHRRCAAATGPDRDIEFGDLRVDVAGCQVTRGGLDINLTRREFSLLEGLLARRGRVVSKERLFERVFPLDDGEVGINALELHVSRLRRKLAGGHVAIRTLRGLGYQLVEED